MGLNVQNLINYSYHETILVNMSVLLKTVSTYVCMFVCIHYHQSTIPNKSYLFRMDISQSKDGFFFFFI